MNPAWWDVHSNWADLTTLPFHCLSAAVKAFDKQIWNKQYCSNLHVQFGVIRLRVKIVQNVQTHLLQFVYCYILYRCPRVSCTLGRLYPGVQPTPGQVVPRGTTCPGVSCTPPWVACTRGTSYPSRGRLYPGVQLAPARVSCTQP